jgi:Flp pilus assembly protein TadD
MNTRDVLYSIALLLGSAAPLFGQATCAPPESMKAKFQGKPSVEALNDLGVWFGDQKQYDCAASVFATSLQMDPDQKDVAHVAFMLGVSLDFTGDVKEAVGAFQEAEQLGYRDIKLHVILAAALDASHANKDAELEWRVALDIDPEYSDALDALSDDLLLDKDFAGTIALLEVPRLLGQRTPKQSVNLATAYAATGKLEAAAGALRDGLNTSPDSLVLANQLAETLVKLNRQGDAATVLELAVAQHPEDPDTAAHYLATLVAVHPDLAVPTAGKLLLAFPQNAALRYLAGVIDLKAGSLQQARAHLEQSLSLDPEQALAHEVLGVVLAQLKDMAGAKAHFERAIALGDNDADAKDNLAKVNAAIGSGK